MPLFDDRVAHVGIAELMMAEGFSEWILAKPDEMLDSLPVSEIFKMYQRERA